MMNPAADARWHDARIAKHLRLQWQLEAEIRSGRYRPGDRFPTHQELMAKYGCSCNTMTKALRGLVDAGLITRRRRAGTVVNDVPILTPDRNANDPAASTIGLFHQGMPTNYHPYFTVLIEGLMAGAESHGMSLKLIRIDEEGLRMDANLLRRHGVCGCVCGGTIASDLSAALELGVPFVYLYREYPDIPVERVLLDQRQFALLAFQHFRQLQHERIVTFSLRNHLLFDEIAAQAYDRLPSQAPHHTILLQSIRKSAIETAMAEYLSLSPRPTAIYVTEDVLLRKIHDAFKDHGIHAPKDVAMVGAGSPMSASFLNLPLTLVESDPKDLGQLAIDRLVAQLNCRGERGRIDRVQGKLVVRGSCGAEATASEQESEWKSWI